MTPDLSSTIVESVIFTKLSNQNGYEIIINLSKRWPEITSHGSDSNGEQTISFEKDNHYHCVKWMPPAFYRGYNLQRYTYVEKDQIVITYIEVAHNSSDILWKNPKMNLIDLTYKLLKEQRVLLNRNN